MAISENLKALRDAKGLTQTQLSEKAGLGINQVSRIERGSSKPELETIKSLAMALDCSADELIFDREEREPDEELRILMAAVANMDDAKKATAIEILKALVMKAEAETWIKK